MPDYALGQCIHRHPQIWQPDSIGLILFRGWQPQAHRLLPRIKDIRTLYIVIRVLQIGKIRHKAARWNSYTLFTNTPKLIYISACYTGNGSTTYGNVGQALVNKGTNAVVAFKNTISASTGTNGIHKFNQKVATKLAYSHYTLSNSLSQALNEIYAEDGQYWGANYKVVYGNGSISF